MNYIRKDSSLPPYLPLPKFLLTEALKQTSQLTYALLLDRVTLSQANGWQDGQGHIYVIFPVEKIAKALGKGLTSVKDALAELEEHGLIRRQRAGPGQPNRIYVLLPDGLETGHPEAGTPAIRGPTIRPSDGQVSGCQMVENPATNNLIDNNLNHNIEIVVAVFVDDKIKFYIEPVDIRQQQYRCQDAGVCSQQLRHQKAGRTCIRYNSGVVIHNIILLPHL